MTFQSRKTLQLHGKERSSNQDAAEPGADRRVQPQVSPWSLILQPLPEHLDSGPPFLTVTDFGPSRPQARQSHSVSPLRLCSTPCSLTLTFLPKTPGENDTFCSSHCFDPTEPSKMTLQIRHRNLCLPNGKWRLRRLS